MTESLNVRIGGVLVASDAPDWEPLTFKKSQVQGKLEITWVANDDDYYTYIMYDDTVDHLHYLLNNISRADHTKEIGIPYRSPHPPSGIHNYIVNVYRQMDSKNPITDLYPSRTMRLIDLVEYTRKNKLKLEDTTSFHVEPDSLFDELKSVPSSNVYNATTGVLIPSIGGNNVNFNQAQNYDRKDVKSEAVNNQGYNQNYNGVGANGVNANNANVNAIAPPNTPNTLGPVPAPITYNGANNQVYNQNYNATNGYNLNQYYSGYNGGNNANNQNYNGGNNQNYNGGNNANNQNYNGVNNANAILSNNPPDDPPTDPPAGKTSPKDIWFKAGELSEDQMKHCRCILEVQAKGSAAEPYAVCRHTGEYIRECAPHYDWSNLPEEEVRAYAALNKINSSGTRQDVLNRIMQWKDANGK